MKITAGILLSLFLFSFNLFSQETYLGKTCDFKLAFRYKIEHEVAKFSVYHHYFKKGLEYHIHRIDHPKISKYFNQLAHDYGKCLKSLPALISENCRMVTKPYEYYYLKTRPYQREKYTTKESRKILDDSFYAYVLKNRENLDKCLRSTHVGALIQKIIKGPTPQNQFMFEKLLNLNHFVNHRGHKKMINFEFNKTITRCRGRDGCDFKYQIKINDFEATFEDN